MTTGKIYLADQDGAAVGVGQAFDIRLHDGGYAAFLTEGDEPQQLSDAYETEALCIAHLDGGTGTVIVIDDL